MRSAPEQVNVIEPTPIPDTFATGIMQSAELSGFVCLTFYRDRAAFDGSAIDRVIVARCIVPAVAVSQITLGPSPSAAGNPPAKGTTPFRPMFCSVT